MEQTEQRCQANRPPYKYFKNAFTGFFGKDAPFKSKLVEGNDGPFMTRYLKNLTMDMAAKSQEDMVARDALFGLILIIAYEKLWIQAMEPKHVQPVEEYFAKERDGNSGELTRLEIEEQRRGRIEEHRRQQSYFSANENESFVERNMDTGRSPTIEAATPQQ
eukprot:gene2509-705_t